MVNKRKMTMGVIVGNRGFFPDHLAKSGREEMMQALQKAGIDVVVLGPEQSVLLHATDGYLHCIDAPGRPRQPADRRDP